MIHIYTGNGKGKTTAALGLALRCAGAGGRVLLLQLLKGRPTGELSSLALIPNIEVLRLGRDYGFYKRMNYTEKEEVILQHNTMLNRALSEAIGGQLDMLIIDEAVPAYNYNALDRQLLKKLLEINDTEIVLTGRNAPEELIKYADYITEMKKLKHPFDEGVVARRKVEY